jgi:hypothetical protein
MNPMAAHPQMPHKKTFASNVIGGLGSGFDGPSPGAATGTWNGLIVQKTKNMISTPVGLFPEMVDGHLL